jgi:hypothetical protein
MSIILGTAKVFASFFLVFVIAETAAAQTDSIYRLPAGTKFQLRVTDEISSKFSNPNDTFRTRLAAPVIVRNVVMIPAGTEVEGRILSASHAGFGGRNGQIAFQMETLRLSDSQFRPIFGVPIAPPAQKREKSFWCLAGFAFLKKGREASLRPDDVIEVVLKKEVVLPVKDY